MSLKNLIGASVRNAHDELMKSPRAQFIALQARRDDLVRRLRRANSADCSYEHNDSVVANIERELERIDDEMQALQDDAADRKRGAE